MRRRGPREQMRLGCKNANSFYEGCSFLGQHPPALEQKLWSLSNGQGNSNSRLVRKISFTPPYVCSNFMPHDVLDPTEKNFWEVRFFLFDHLFNSTPEKTFS